MLDSLNSYTPMSFFNIEIIAVHSPYPSTSFLGFRMFLPLLRILVGYWESSTCLADYRLNTYPHRFSPTPENTKSLSCFILNLASILIIVMNLFRQRT
ncbi:hypothetical protein CW304_26190 [Bacillus sp. UFRGS-B20]|nr:hypothetical protein CW304_26190 [Bacillus sp. UFRGS-B20]